MVTTSTVCATSLMSITTAEYAAQSLHGSPSRAGLTLRANPPTDGTEEGVGFYLPAL